MIENPESSPIAALRADLRGRFGRIPTYIWRKVFPDFTMPVGYQTIESSLLPAGIPYGSHEVDGSGKKLKVPHVVGNDVVENFFARNGRLFIRLVHYARDGYDSDKGAPSEVLGEITDEDVYKATYKEALVKLQLLERLKVEAEQVPAS